MTNIEKTEKYLQENGIEYQMFHHPAVFTCAEAAEHCQNIPGVPGKNLFLRDEKKKRIILYSLPAAKKVDLKKLASSNGIKKLSFGSPELLKEKLDLIPGAVSPLGLINDEKHSVEFWVDKDILEAPLVNFHPGDNSASVVFSGEMFEKLVNSFQNKKIIVASGE
jgi:Ala-tRNA(Pro) deacylase